MKLNHFFTIAFIFLIISIASCSKDQSSMMDPQNPATPVDSNYLSVLYDISKKGAVTDTVSSFKYYYDASKRVIRLVDSVWHPSSDYRKETTVYYYNGNDSLPYKSIRTTVMFLPQPDYVVTGFYFYNSSGLKIKDSVISPALHSKAQYQYMAGMIVSTRLDSIFSAPAYTFSYSETRKDTATQDANGNVISTVSRRGSANVVRSAVTYDNHVNPFLKLSNAKTLALFPTGETLFFEMAQKNNRLRITETVTVNNQPPYVGYEDDLSGKYTYKTNDLPEKITVTDPVTGEIEIAAFTYIAL